MHCKDCAHWKRPEPDYQAEAVTFGTCAAIPFRYDHLNEAFDLIGKHRSDFDEWDEVEKIEADTLAATLAMCEDGSGYAGRVKTQGEFGCVLFEVKP